jgi:hypothetical protein
MRRALIVVGLVLVLILSLGGPASAHILGGGPSGTATLSLTGNAAKWEGSTVICTAGEQVNLGGRLIQGSTIAQGSSTQLCTGDLQAIEPLFRVKGNSGPLVPGAAIIERNICTKAGGVIDQCFQGTDSVTLV